MACAIGLYVYETICKCTHILYMIHMYMYMDVELHVGDE